MTNMALATVVIPVVATIIRSLRDRLAMAGRIMVIASLIAKKILAVAARRPCRTRPSFFKQLGHHANDTL